MPSAPAAYQSSFSGSPCALYVYSTRVVPCFAFFREYSLRPLSSYLCRSCSGAVRGVERPAAGVCAGVWVDPPSCLSDWLQDPKVIPTSKTPAHTRCFTTLFIIPFLLFLRLQALERIAVGDGLLLTGPK